MQHDGGEVLPGLNENWTFLGANIMEWAAGLVVFIMISLFGETPARAMPFMIVGWVLTTTTLASIRISFPDEERGVRNAVMTACGFPPLKIPAPASIQPVWSACPMREVPKEWKFSKLGFDQMFPSFQREFVEDELDPGA